MTGSAAVPDAVRASSRNPSTYYRVRRGDTLSSIARLFNTTVDKIKSWNRLRGSALTVGKKLLIRKR